MASKPDESYTSTLPKTMGNPARRALANAGYTRLEQLAGVSEASLLALHGVGSTGIARLKAALAEIGLALSK